MQAGIIPIPVPFWQPPYTLTPPCPTPFCLTNPHLTELNLLPPVFTPPPSWGFSSRSSLLRCTVCVSPSIMDYKLSHSYKFPHTKFDCSCNNHRNNFSYEWCRVTLSLQGILQQYVSVPLSRKPSFHGKWPWWGRIFQASMPCQLW